MNPVSGIGICGVGYGGEQPAPTGRHDLQITTTYDDGHQDTWTYSQPGTARDAHDALAKRWKDAGATFTRDRANKVLTRHYDAARCPEVGAYTDEIRHEDIT